VIQAEQALATAQMNSMSRWIYRIPLGDYQQVVMTCALSADCGDRVVKAIYYSAVLTDQESIKAAG